MNIFLGLLLTISVPFSMKGAQCELVYTGDKDGKHLVYFVPREGLETFVLIRWKGIEVRARNRDWYRGEGK